MNQSEQPFICASSPQREARLRNGISARGGHGWRVAWGCLLLVVGVLSVFTAGSVDAAPRPTSRAVAPVKPLSVAGTWRMTWGDGSYLTTFGAAGEYTCSYLGDTYVGTYTLSPERKLSIEEWVLVAGGTGTVYRWNVDMDRSLSGKTDSGRNFGLDQKLEKITRFPTPDKPEF